MKKVLLAVGGGAYSNILQRNFSKERDFFTLCDQEVMHFRYMSEIIEIDKPDILIVHDHYLPSEKTEGEERQEEWLNFIQALRAEYDDSIRIVFLCERPKDDTFLSYLVSINVLDIFNERAIDIQQMMDQLKDKPRYSLAAKFIQQITPRLLNYSVDDEDIRETEDEQADSEDTIDEQLHKIDKEEKKGKKEEKKKERPQKVIVKKVIEKKIEKKVVHKTKNVIKRDYNIQITNQVEKIVGVPIQSVTILIGSPFSRSGSTFVSHLLARELARLGVSVSYIESPYSSAYSFDRFIGHKRNPDYRSKFYQFTKEIDPKMPSIYDWEVDDVNMIVRHPTNEPIYGMKEIPFEVYVKILLASQSTVTILDVGTDWNQDIYRDLYDIATHTLFILEPDISNIQFLEDPDNIATENFMQMLQDDKTHIIGNRFDKKLLDNPMIDALYAEKMISYIPCFTPNEIFESHYKGTFFNDFPKNQKIIREALNPIIECILPKEFLKKRGRNGKLFNGLFNKSIKIEERQEDLK
ncbi:hypothetical protein [Metabacillus halosaccharovorans]|uniref:hypothetical protein n=1 Tax=Metabacillus halosaccharovorans TaxID=930124 RepID=UPI001C1F4F4A|nr:hypothetical protein [Metabacillus halosaccharovorans]MBU7595894.1 hypothetical protein [Metabacillus halosaccharovorans]